MKRNKLWNVPSAGSDIIQRTTETNLQAEREARRWGGAAPSYCVYAPTARQAVWLVGLMKLGWQDPRVKVTERHKVPVIIERRAPGLMTSAEACR